MWLKRLKESLPRENAVFQFQRRCDIFVLQTIVVHIKNFNHEKINHNKLYQLFTLCFWTMPLLILKFCFELKLLSSTSKEVSFLSFCLFLQETNHKKPPILKEIIISSKFYDIDVKFEDGLNLALL